MIKFKANFKDEDWRRVFRNYITEVGRAKVKFEDNSAEITTGSFRFVWCRDGGCGLWHFNEMLHRKFGLECTKLVVKPSWVPFRVNIIVTVKSQNGGDAE